MRVPGCTAGVVTKKFENVAPGVPIRARDVRHKRE